MLPPVAYKPIRANIKVHNVDKETIDDLKKLAVNETFHAFSKCKTYEIEVTKA